MKLFEVILCNNLEYEDADYEVRLIVASDLAKAETRASNLLKEVYPSGYREPFHIVKEIIEVDGFKIKVSS